MNRLIMKLIKTTDMNAVNDCQDFLSPFLSFLFISLSLFYLLPELLYIKKGTENRIAEGTVADL